ncbi:MULTISPECIES: diacylglycerol kinase family protein [unclassified Niallia]|uniref:diacylglycerol kinase family protein n=1 Tax=Niallia TaxID=2837506 RepID=UPI001EDB93D7|nr:MULTISPECIES: diacylglycerol kinase family protein [unclassified Niallia]MDL0436560.1 diacylglycerol kinase family protein [Niallia sp. SS-2023]UPO86607.1 diacylglycerol kinase family protein [Niallia sp. Man26]
MNLDSKDKRIQKNSQLSSFRLAFIGIISAVKKERNLRIHLCFTALVILLGFVFHISVQNWMFLSIAIGLVICMELMNTALERVVDLVTEKYHPLAKQAKDIAAGAVLFAAIIALIIGMFVFVPEIMQLMSIGI